MILIEVNNQETISNFKLLEETEKWAKNNIGDGDYTIVLNPNLEGNIKILDIEKERDLTGIVFTTPESKKQYRVIEEHKLFKDTWRCYPEGKEPPYKESHMDCFSREFIERALETPHYIGRSL